MSIPISIDQLLERNIVESARVEYKKSWNPEAVLRTICAYANDIDHWGGGYIVIGVSERNGQVILPPVGLSSEMLDRSMKELLEITKLIKPNYLPICEPVIYQNKHLLLIWAPGGYDRPYDCPSSLSSRKTERVSYVRKMSSTMKASIKDRQELHDLGTHIPYDDRQNPHAQVFDLKLNLIKNYLVEIKSGLLDGLEERTLEEVAGDMRILDGPPECLKPINAGLMFFNYDPEKFFRYARIDVVTMPDPTGTGMIERTFRGPLNDQLVGALQYIKNTLIAEKITKLEHQAEAIRVYNYPFTAVEELLTNAIFHKSYQLPEPVSVRITRDELIITSCPGPESSITDEDLRSGTFRGRRYRNRRIGDFLKELNLAEGRNTGIPTVESALRLNGSPPAIYRTDDERSYFEVTLKIHPSFKQETEETPKPQKRQKRRSREELEVAILEVLVEENELSTNELAIYLGYGSVSKTLSEVVTHLIEKNILEYTYPDQLNSPKQKLRLSSTVLHENSQIESYIQRSKKK